MGSTVCSALYYRARCTAAHVVLPRTLYYRARCTIAHVVLPRTLDAVWRVAHSPLSVACRLVRVLPVVCSMVHVTVVCCTRCAVVPRMLSVACRAACTCVACCMLCYSCVLQCCTYIPAIHTSRHATDDRQRTSCNIQHVVRCMLHVAPAAGFALRRKAHRPVTHRPKDQCPARVRVCECVRVCVCVCLCVCTCVRVIVGAHMCVRASRSSCFY